MPIARRLARASAVALGLALPAATMASTGAFAGTETGGGSVYGSATTTPAPPTDKTSTATTLIPTRAGARPTLPTSPSKTTATVKKPTKAVHLGDRLPLRRGMSGHDVRVLQDYLSRTGITATIDGAFGDATHRALKRFQKRAKLKQTGVLTAGGLQKLRMVADEGGFDLQLASVATPQAAGEAATLNPDGTATAPATAPPAVQAMIDAGNEIAKMPYKYGGGHGTWDDTGYDCSGSVSYVLHAAGLLTVARDSTGLESFGAPGAGRWVTVYGKASHAYMVVAGLRFDTSGRSRSGSRWQVEQRDPVGYVVRHPGGL